MDAHLDAERPSRRAPSWGFSMLAPLCLLIVLGLTRFDQGPV
jgi:hypothetical protein